VDAIIISIVNLELHLHATWNFAWLCMGSMVADHRIRGTATIIIIVAVSLAKATAFVVFAATVGVLT